MIRKINLNGTIHRDNESTVVQVKYLGYRNKKRAANIIPTDQLATMTQQYLVLIPEFDRGFTI